MVKREYPELTRQLDIMPLAALALPIRVIGAGAVGSMTTWALARMGFNNIEVWDFDRVEVENLNCQLYTPADIGQYKVTALLNRVADDTGVAIIPFAERYPAAGVQPAGHAVTITAVDSMASRQAIWEAYRARAVGCQGYIDPRMGAEYATFYVTQPMAKSYADLYAKTLHSDAEGVNEPCTRKATIYTSLLLGGAVAKVVKDIATGRDPVSYMFWDIANDDVEFGPRKPINNL